MATKEVIPKAKKTVQIVESQEFIDALYKISPQERFAIEAMRGGIRIGQEA
ncbi:MAG: hypothetical protein AABW80_04180 [Nanoarchaeota archaeon]